MDNSILNFKSVGSCVMVLFCPKYASDHLSLNKMFDFSEELAFRRLLSVYEEFLLRPSNCNVEQATLFLFFI